jgi:ABC-type bacteriocin/lantibiotic exporter with double-glycine peptidase domain
MEALECGATCLAMVMAYYDKWVSPEQVRADCDVSRDGSNAKCVVKAARLYGFEASGYKLTAQNLKENGTFPCILFWNNEHFVVLDGFRRNHAIINDPAEGRVNVPMKDFEKAFSGVCLNITPGPEFSPSGKRKSTLVFAHNKLKTAVSAVVFTAATAVISYLFGIINPIMTQIFLDMILPGKAPMWVMPFIGIMSLLAALQVTVDFINAIYTFKISGKLSVAGSTSFMWKILGLPMEFFSQRMAGDILQRKESNANIVRTLVKTLGPIVLDVFLMIFYLVIMIKRSLILTLVGVSAQVINLFFSRLISAKQDFRQETSETLPHRPLQA